MDKKKRLVYADYLRALATVFVIGVHTVSLGASLLEEQSKLWYFFEICNYLFLCCNILFIMISGALLLSETTESAIQFYKKRVAKVFVPMAVYYIFYVCAKEGIAWIFPNHWLLLFKRILLGAPEEAPHFWLIYVILWLYVLTPLFRLVIKKFPRDAVGFFNPWNVAAAGILIFHIICTYFDIFYNSALFSYISNTYVGVFFLGAYLAKEHKTGTKAVIFLSGILSAGLALHHILNGQIFERYLFNYAPLMLFYAMAVFLFVKELCRKQTHVPVFVQILSKHSFGILLIHWGVLHVAVKQLLHISPISIGSALLMIVLTLLFSLAGAILLDKTILAWIQRSFL